MCEGHDENLEPLSESPKQKSHKRSLSSGSQQDSPKRRSTRVSSVHRPEESPEPTPAVKGEPDEEEETKLKTKSLKKEAVAKESKPTKKGRKTKEEKESYEMPLRPRTKGLKMFVGAHVSAAAGVFNSIHNSEKIGGNAFALFLKSQRKWDNPPLLDEHRDKFVKLSIEKGYDVANHVLPHGSYLVNLAQEDKVKSDQAYKSFIDDLRRCEALGIKLYNFHPGSSNGTPLPEALGRLAKNLTKAIEETSTVIPVLETMCGHGTTIGGYLAEFRDLLALIPKEHHDRIGICIDTCHSFAAGYDLVSPEGFKAFLAEFDELIGIKFLRALHLNDSKAPFGSKRDLHANIGTGFLGLRAFHNVMNEPRFEGLPMVLETPIDRPANEVKDEKGDEPPKKKSKKTGSALVPDLTVWAKEIKLLESLIEMDPEGEEFRALEALLSEEGRTEREKNQQQHDKKLETDKKKAVKAKEKGQKSLTDMMKGGKN